MAKEMVKVATATAGADPRIAVFAISAACVVALAGMALGYDVDLNVLGNGVRISKSAK